jgi:hypothetical protein
MSCAVYQDFANLGQVYGPAFHGLTALSVREDEAALGSIITPSPGAVRRILAFPPALDACFHAAAALRRSRDRRAFVVAAIREVRVFQPLPDKIWSHISLRPPRRQRTSRDLALYNRDGVVMAQLHGVKLLAMNAEFKAGSARAKYYEFGWEPMPLPTNSVRETSDAVLVFAGGEDSAHPWQMHCGQGRWKQPSFSMTGNPRPMVHWRWICGSRIGRGSCGELSPPADPFQRECSISGAWRTRRVAPPFSLSRKPGWRSQTVDDATRWLIVTRDAQVVGRKRNPSPARAALWGFVACRADRTTALAHLPGGCRWRPQCESLLDEFFAAEPEPEVALRPRGATSDGLRQFQPGTTTRFNGRPRLTLCRLRSPGRVDSLGFRGKARSTPVAGEVEVEVAAAGLNFRDLMKALGVYPSHEDEPVTLGDEFAGTIVRVGRSVRRLRPGDRVMGFAPTAGPSPRTCA